MAICFSSDVRIAEKQILWAVYMNCYTFLLFCHLEVERFVKICFYFSVTRKAVTLYLLRGKRCLGSDTHASKLHGFPFASSTYTVGHLYESNF